MDTTSEIAARHGRLRRAMAGAGFDALVIVGNAEFQQKGYVRYYAGWRLHGGTAFLVVSHDRPPVLLMGLGAQAEWAKELGAVPDTRAVLDKVAATADAVREAVPAGGRIGVVGHDAILPAGDAARLRARLPDATIEDATDLVEGLWCILSADDLAAVETAHARVNRIFDAFREAIRPDRRELDVVARTVATAVSEGCLEGVVHLNHDDKAGTRPATGRVIRPDDVYKMFMEFLTPEGYLIEFGACFSFRDPGPAWRAKHDLVARAIDDAIAETRPGMVADDLVRRIRATYDAAGVEVVGRRLWDFHGQGMHSLLRPFGLPGSQDPIHETMMINIHPGLLTADGLGISATNNYVVGKDGGRALGGFRHRWHLVE
jgi:Xaa-Pro aminopeptidase